MRYAVVLLVVLAGCAGEPAEQTMDMPSHAMHQMQNVTFFDDVTDVSETFTGTFAATDHSTIQGVAGSAGQPPTNVHQHDVSSLIPDGVPAFVEIQVESGQNVGAWLQTSDFAAIWTSDCGGCSGGFGTEWSGAVIDSGEDFSVNVFYAGGQVPAEQPYEVSFRVSAAPDRLPSGVVIEVDMPRVGSHILFESVDGPVPDIMVFDPADNYLTTLPASDPQLYIGENQTTGAYVFLPMAHGTFYKLRSGGDLPEGESLDVKARILDQVIETSGPRTAGEGGSYSVDLSVQPLQVGILMFGFVGNGGTFEASGPDGFSLDLGVAGPTTGFGAFAATDMGDDSLQPGTYTFTWETPNNDGNTQVQEFFTLYGR